MQTGDDVCIEIIYVQLQIFGSEHSRIYEVHNCAFQVPISLNIHDFQYECRHDFADFTR